MSLEFFVAGIPQPQPRPKAARIGNHIHIMKTATKNSRKHVARVCEWCGAQFSVPQSWVAQGGGRFCCCRCARFAMHARKQAERGLQFPDNETFAKALEEYHDVLSRACARIATFEGHNIPFDELMRYAEYRLAAHMRRGGGVNKGVLYNGIVKGFWTYFFTFEKPRKETESDNLCALTNALANAISAPKETGTLADVFAVVEGKDATALRMRLDGAKHKEIAVELGYKSYDSVANAIKRAMERVRVIARQEWGVAV